MHVTNKIRSLSPIVYALNGGMGLEYNAEFRWNCRINFNKKEHFKISSNKVLCMKISFCLLQTI